MASAYTSTTTTSVQERTGITITAWTSAPAVWKGLAGLHLISDDEERALPLHDGERDVPLMLMDRAFAADGSLRYPSVEPSLLERQGDVTRCGSGLRGYTRCVNVAWVSS